MHITTTEYHDCVWVKACELNLNERNLIDDND